MDSRISAGAVHPTPTFIFFDSNGRELWRSIGWLDVNLLNNYMK